MTGISGRCIVLDGIQYWVGGSGGVGSFTYGWSTLRGLGYFFAHDWRGKKRAKRIRVDVALVYFRVHVWLKFRREDVRHHLLLLFSLGKPFFLWLKGSGPDIRAKHRQSAAAVYHF